MIMHCLSSLLVGLSIIAAPPADSIDVILGTWVSPDGLAKQQFVEELDGSWISTRMWFKTDGGWKLVGTGGMYRRPGEAQWRVVSRTTDMDGIDLFESTLDYVAEGQYRLSNIAYQSDGSLIKTEEDWIFSGPDRFEYTVYKLEDGDRSPWISGVWVREPDEP